MRVWLVVLAWADSYTTGKLMSINGLIIKFIATTLKIGGSIFLLLVITIFIYSVFWTPNEEKARRLVRSVFHYYPPSSTKLIYSKNYWASFNGREPRSICLIFQYTQKDFINLQNTNFSLPNHRHSFYTSSPISKDKGCVEFDSSLKNKKFSFVKQFEYFYRLEGGTIFADSNNKIVMFEVYLYD